MPYIKQEFIDYPDPNATVLSTKHLQYIEDGIVAAFSEIPKFIVKTISLPAANWTGSGSIYSQTVEMTGITSFSKVDLLPSPEQLRELLLAEISLTTANSDGSITVFAIGAVPTSDYQMQALVTEVTIEVIPDPEPEPDLEPEEGDGTDEPTEEIES